MGKTISGNLSAAGMSFAIVVARFNHFITEKLHAGAVDTLVRHGAKEDDIDTIWTPGAFELPAVVQRLVGKPYSAVIVLGCVIRGGTPHFDYVAGEAAKGIGQVALTADKPVSFGVLTCDTIEQAIERAGTKAGNKGADAALAAVEMVGVFAALDE